MSKTLIAIRHAKSDWPQNGAPDIERPLTKRGLRDAQLIGHWLTTYCSNKHIYKLHLLTSPASRAQLTANTIVEAFSGIPLQVDTVDALYLASRNRLLEIIQQQDDNDNCIALVGHNPGMQELVEFFSGESLRKFPTCATACFEFSGDDWRGIGPQNCVDSTIIKPKFLRQH